jgi:hypothetical protein
LANASRSRVDDVELFESELRRLLSVELDELDADDDDDDDDEIGKSDELSEAREDVLTPESMVGLIDLRMLLIMGVSVVVDVVVAVLLESGEIRVVESMG